MVAGTDGAGGDVSETDMNVRMVVFGLVALTLIGFPAYVFLDEKLSGGIKNRGDFFEVSLKAMSSFEMDQNNGTDEDVPAQWRNLDGKKIQVEGEMWIPDNASARVGQFELVYSIAKCCFSGPPKIQHFVLCTPAPGSQVEVYSGLVRVTGKLQVKVERSEGRVTRVYRMAVERVEPV